MGELNGFEDFGRRVAKLVASNEWRTLDTDDLADLAEKCGVVERVPFDRVKHADIEGAEELTDGDSVYEWLL